MRARARRWGERLSQAGSGRKAMESHVAGALSLGSRRRPPPAPAHPATPPASSARTHGRAGETCPVRRHTSGPRAVRPTRSIWADRIRFDTRHHRPPPLPLAPAAPAPLGSVDPVRPIGGWLYVLGSCGALQTGRVTREPRKSQRGKRLPQQQARAAGAWRPR
jgi:hypothetical protein